MKKSIVLFLSIMALLSGCSQNKRDYISSNQVNSIVEQSSSPTIEEDDNKMTESVEPIKIQVTDYDIPGIENKIWTIEDLYQKEDKYLETEYSINDAGELWASGYNDYGQLGIGTQIDTYNVRFVETPQKVFDHVIHISFSGEYFAAFITGDYKLYGMGANLDGVMCMPRTENDQNNPWYTISSSPKLLMDDVKYAVCSSRSILALKTDGSVWVLGEKNSNSNPKKVMNQAKIIVAGNNNLGAITDNGDLWLWGDNNYGQCAVADSEFVETPHNVASGVAMCWFPIFKNQTIIKKVDGTIQICGYGVGQSVKTVDVFSDLAEEKEITYSTTFLPAILE